MDPLEKIRLLFIRLLEVIETDSEYQKILQLMQFKTEITPEMQPYIEQKIENSYKIGKIIGEMIEDAQNKKEIRKEIDTNLAMMILLSIYTGISTMWLIDPSRFSLKTLAPKMIDSVLASWT